MLPEKVDVFVGGKASFSEKGVRGAWGCRHWALFASAAAVRSHLACAVFCPQQAVVASKSNFAFPYLRICWQSYLVAETIAPIHNYLRLFSYNETDNLYLNWISMSARAVTWDWAGSDLCTHPLLCIWMLEQRGVTDFPQHMCYNYPV